jgi:uncharacterized protein (DUF1697 family)
MAKHVAFLRGVNVGGRIVKMADLKTCLEKAGFKDIKTFLQSGNILIESNRSDAVLKKEIEGLLSETFHYDAKLQVLSLAKLQKIIDGYPFGKAGASQHDYVIFMENGLEKQIIKEEYSLADGEKLKTGEGVLYWRIDKGSTLKSDFSKLLSKAKYRDFNTNRNLRTLHKIATGG